MKFFIVISFLLSYNIYSQNVIGKDFANAKNDLKNLFIKEGFNFDKEHNAKICESPNFKSAVDVFFKEDLRITVTRDEHDKVFSVLIYTQTKKVVEIVSNLFNYSEWTYISKQSDRKNYQYDKLSFSLIKKKNRKYTEYGISIQK